MPELAGMDPLRRYHPLISDIRAFEDALQAPMPRFIWAHPNRTTPEFVQDALICDGFDARPLSWHPGAFAIFGHASGLGSHFAHLAGLFQIQEASAMAPVLLLDPRPGERVLDLCAAPGNKTAQIALAIGNHGTVAANDLVWGRLAPLRTTVNRLGLLNVCITCFDGMSYPKSAGGFDAVLVDAPCSCEGISRKNQRVLNRPLKNLKKRTDRQFLLLRQGFRRCKPGGRLLYSTCTYAPEENEAVVDRLVREFPGRVRILPADLPGFAADPGVTRWDGESFHPHLSRTLRIWPHLNDSGGFFMALLEKTGEDPYPHRQPPRVCEAEGKIGEKDDQVPLAEREALLDHLFQRFGIPQDAFSPYFFVASHQLVSAVAADHRPPLISGRFMGLPLIRKGNRFHKITTAGTMAFGHLAEKNVVDLNLEQTVDFMNRKSVVLLPAQFETCDRDGHVFVKYRKNTLGIGELKRDTATMGSLFPKRWGGHATE